MKYRHAGAIGGIVIHKGGAEPHDPCLLTSSAPWRRRRNTDGSRASRRVLLLARAELTEVELEIDVRGKSQTKSALRRERTSSSLPSSTYPSARPDCPGREEMDA
jgi:hypothetical protein